MKTSVGTVLVVVLAALTICGGCFSNSQPASIQFLGGLPMPPSAAKPGVPSTYRSKKEMANDYFVSHGCGISNDGLTVVGRSRSSGFVWTNAGGLKDVGRFPKWKPISDDSDTVFATLVSGDGSVVAGTRYFDAFRWTNAGGMTPLTHWMAGADGAISATSVFDVVSAARNVEHAKSLKLAHPYFKEENIRAQVFGINGDGNVVVGSLQTDQLNEHAVCWNRNGAATYLGTPSLNALPSAANGVSEDGTVIVGRFMTQSGTEPFRWTATTGMMSLGALPRRWRQCIAYCISGDGTTVAGSYEPQLNHQRLFIWTAADGYRDLGVLKDAGQMEARRITPWAMCYDGSCVVGEYVGRFDSQPFIWTTKDGLRDLEAVATAAGIPLNGYKLQVAKGISADGTTIVGIAADPQKRAEGFLLNLGR